VARRLAPALLLALFLSGRGSSDPHSDRESVQKLYDDLTGYAASGDYAEFCRRSTRRFADAAAYSGSASTCAGGLEHNRGELPSGRLVKLRISGSRASGSFREGTGELADIKFGKEGGDGRSTALPTSSPGPRSRSSRSPTDPGKLHTAEGREIAHVVTDWYGGLVNQDTAAICENVTPTQRKKAIAIGSIRGAKTCPAAYRAIFDQIRFSYDTVPKVVRVTISGKRAVATSEVEGKTLRRPSGRSTGPGR
jgi:hypothetical protein